MTGYAANLILCVINKNPLLILTPFIFGIAVIALSKVVKKMSEVIWMASLGIHPCGFYALDYESLFLLVGGCFDWVAVRFGAYLVHHLASIILLYYYANMINKSTKICNILYWSSF